MAEEEEEYESDPEQSKLSLKMRRRREASDDEEEDDADDDSRVRVIDSRVLDYESDGQGAAAEYNDDDDDELEEELVEEDDGVIEGTSVGVEREIGDQVDDNANGEQGDRKEKEPFAVPTAGAFYMHDDRFRHGTRGGRRRRTIGGKKLWELRDDNKWGHDKFEEMTTRDRHYYERTRVPRGRNRGRGRNRAEGRELPKNFNNNNNNQTTGPKSVRGRGPRRYQPSERQPTKPMEKTSHASSGRASTATSASESARVVKKYVVVSNLDYASPPYYPSGSSTRETNFTSAKDAQSGSLNRGPRPLVMTHNYPISQSNIPQRRNVSVSLGIDKLHIGDSISKPLNNTQTPFGQVAYQPVRFGARSASWSQAFSPPITSGHAHGLESIEVESSTESNDFNTASVGKGKGGVPSSGMSSFSYGDQNFSRAPTFLPGQHLRGRGVPAVGMAFPGYVGQPNGTGNSEMTWLPVLAGAAGLGAPYHQYMTVDGIYNTRSSGQPASLTPINKDSNMNNSSHELKPSQQPELEKDELSLLRQRQNKARRYTEMKFDK